MPQKCSSQPRGCVKDYRAIPDMLILVPKGVDLRNFQSQCLEGKKSLFALLNPLKQFFDLSYTVY